MGQRYGRNQRRAHRERIKQLEASLASAQFRASSAERRVASAREDALREFVRSKPYFDEAMRRISSELARAMGPHFQPHVERLMQADQTHRYPAPIAFDARLSPKTVTVSYIEGRIEPIIYRVALSYPWEFAA